MGHGGGSTDMNVVISVKRITRDYWPVHDRGRAGGKKQRGGEAGRRKRREGAGREGE